MPNVPALEESGTSASQGTGRGQGEGTVGEKTSWASCMLHHLYENKNDYVHMYMYMYMHVHFRKVTALGVLCCFALLFV